jgi:uncharacterized iron-regulated membrane protein
MRKWHRWISVFFGIFLLWIAITGTLSQIVPLMSGGEGPPKTAAQAGTPAKPASSARRTICAARPKGGARRSSGCCTICIRAKALARSAC